MPIYQYECLTCGTNFEKRQGFHDEPVADCPQGHGDTRRLIAAPAIVFKGSGFYINDSKSKNSSSNGSAGPKDTESKGDTSSESKSDSSSDSKATESKTAESKAAISTESS
jgi:putative FmdB family regulatory protein